MDEKKSWFTDWNKNPILWLLRKMEFHLILYPHLMSKNDSIAWSALSRFDELADPSAVPAMLKKLKNEEDKDVRHKIICTLQKIAEKNPQHKKVAKAVPYLLKELNSDFSGTEVCRTLAKIEDHSVVSSLIGILKDKKPGWRRVANTLARIVEKGMMVSETVPVLIETLNEEDLGARIGVIDVLGKIGDERAVPALSETLKDHDEKIKFAAAYALVKIAKKLSEKEDHSSALKIIKDVTAEVREFYNQKKYRRDRDKLKERRVRYEYFNKVVMHIKGRINRLDNKEPLEWKTPKPTTSQNKKIAKRAKAF